MSRILFATICLIVYGSLYPWHFEARLLPANPLWMLAGAWPDHLSLPDIKDILVNLALYTPLGMFGFLSLSPRRPTVVRLGVPIAIGFALSCSMEMLQLFVPGRFTSALDVTTNTTGSAIGVACGVWFESHLRRIQTGLQSIHYQKSSSLLLLICLAAYRLFPFFPDYRVLRMQHKLMAVATISEFSLTLFLATLVEWLAVARLVETAVDPLWAPRVYLAVLLLVPAKVLVVGNTTNCSELGGAALAYFVWRYGLAQSPRRSQILAALFTALIVLRGLAPYHFTSVAAPFSWTPFRALFETEWVSGTSIILGKLFAYGTFVWLLLDSGCRRWYAAMGAAATLGAIEAAQMYLPGRVAEITDPLMALLLAWIFSVVDRATIKVR